MALISLELRFSVSVELLPESCQNTAEGRSEHVNPKVADARVWVHKLQLRGCLVRIWELSHNHRLENSLSDADSWVNAASRNGSSTANAAAEGEYNDQDTSQFVINLGVDDRED